MIARARTALLTILLGMMAWSASAAVISPSWRVRVEATGNTRDLEDVSSIELTDEFAERDGATTARARVSWPIAPTLSSTANADLKTGTIRLFATSQLTGPLFSRWEAPPRRGVDWKRLFTFRTTPSCLTRNGSPK